MAENRGDLWVFGYGSLMWRPGFGFEERVLATVRGYHRSLCVYSHVYRGSPDHPGLVFGLERGGACRGVAFRVAAAARDATIAYLREREQITLVYREVLIPARLADGRRTTALAYVVEPHHPQYAGRLPLAERVRLVRHGVGVSGRNTDYVRNTHEHLVTLGIADPTLASILEELDRPLSTVQVIVADPAEGRP